MRPKRTNELRPSLDRSKISIEPIYSTELVQRTLIRFSNATASLYWKRSHICFACSIQFVFSQSCQNAMYCGALTQELPAELTFAQDIAGGK